MYRQLISGNMMPVWMEEEIGKGNKEDRSRNYAVFGNGVLTTKLGV